MRWFPALQNCWPPCSNTMRGWSCARCCFALGGAAPGRAPTGSQPDAADCGHDVPELPPAVLGASASAPIATAMTIPLVPYLPMTVLPSGSVGDVEMPRLD